VALNWGINAAAIFGRQKIEGHVEARGTYFFGSKTTHYLRNGPISRSRSVLVPNVGGFAGVSVRYPNVKVSLGYRADFFFGAMDAGIDARHTRNVGFHGPFAKISIGLGG
jgi:hypothetical protein